MSEKAKKVLPIYKSIEGMLQQAPSADSAYTTDPSTVEYYHKAIDKLKEIDSEDNYDDFRVNIESFITGYTGGKIPVEKPGVRIMEYRQKMVALLGHLNGKFFPNKPTPNYGNVPSTVFNQNLQQHQEQVQSQAQQMLLDIQEKLIEKKEEYPENTPERKFIDKLKDGLSSVKNYIDFLALTYQVAKTVGLSLEKAIDILK